MTLDEVVASEEEIVRNLFDLEEVLAFQREHELQIVRGDDYQYFLSIDRKHYGTSITPMAALVIGIHQYKSIQK